LFRSAEAEVLFYFPIGLAICVIQRAQKLERASDVCKGSWLRENSEIEVANGNFVSTSVNLKDKSAGDGCRDKTIEKTILRAFRARTFSRSQGHFRKSALVTARSAFPPGADVVSLGTHDRLAPKGAIRI